jgi:hypothetical protein
LLLQVGWLPVFYKQRDNLFLTGFALNMPTCLLRIPYSLIKSFIWCVITYYVVGLAPQADRWAPFFTEVCLLEEQQKLSAFCATEKEGSLC